MGQVVLVAEVLRNNPDIWKDGINGFLKDFLGLLTHKGYQPNYLDYLQAVITEFTKSPNDQVIM